MAPTPAASLPAASSSLSTSSASSSTSNVSSASHALEAAMADPTAGFSFAKAPKPAPLGGAGAGQRGASGGGVEQANKVHKAFEGAGQGAGARKKPSSADLSNNDGEEEYDTPALLTITSTSRLPATAPFKPTSSSSLRPVPFAPRDPDPTAGYHLPAHAYGSPPRQLFSQQSQQQQRFRPPGFAAAAQQGGAGGPSTPAQQTGPQPAHPLSGAAHGPGGKEPHPHPDPPSHQNQPSSSAQGGAASQPMQSGIPHVPRVPRAVQRAVMDGGAKKRKRSTQDAVPPAPPQGAAAPPLAAAGTSRKSTGSTGSVGLGRTVSAKGEQPAGKRRKTDSYNGGGGGGGAEDDFAGVMAQVSSWRVEKQARDDEIRHLRAQLADKTAEAQQLLADKTKLKGEMLSQLRGALASATSAADEFKSAREEMRQGVQELKVDMGGAASASALREELEAVKSEFSNAFANEAQELWIERNDEAKVAVLKELQAELIKRTDVLTLLRSDLDRKTGELTESQSRVSDLTSRLDVLEASRAVAQTALEEERARWAAERGEAARRVEEVLERGVEREEQCARLVGEANGREGRVREEMGRVRREAEGREEELRKEKRAVEEAAEAARRRVGEMEEQLAQVRRELAAKDRECEDLQTRIAKLEHHQRDAGKEVEELQQELRKARETNGTLENSLCQSRRENDEAKQELSRRASKVEQLQQQAEREAEQHVAEVTKLQAAVQELEAQLEAARAVQPHSPSPATVAQADEVVQLRAQVDELKGAFEGLSVEKEGWEKEREGMEESLRAAADSESRLVADRTTLSNRISLTDEDLSTARTALAEKDVALEVLREKEKGWEEERKGWEERAREEREKAVRAAVEQTKDQHRVEMGKKSNELKRARNQLEEMTKKLNKAQNELAKQKGTTVLNQHLNSSSDSAANGTVPVKVRPADAAAPALAAAPADPLVDPSSELTAVESSEGGSPKQNGGARDAKVESPRKSKGGKVVKFNVLSSTTSTSDKPKRPRPSSASNSTHAPGASKPLPVIKKIDASSASTSANGGGGRTKKRTVGPFAAAATAAIEDSDGEEEQEEEDEVAMLELPGAAVGAGKGGGSGGGGRMELDESDPVEPADTQPVVANKGKNRSTARTTYSSKKRR
ncbi:hypothetical protein JCM8097_005036 [Rhodosporidiobolus ruineniae]